MSRNATPAAHVVADAPVGIIRVYVPGAPDPKLARSLAQKSHGFGSVGKTPPATKASRGHMYDFAPVVVTPAQKVTPARKAPSGKPAQDLRATLRATLGLTSAQLDVLVPMLVGKPAAAPAKTPRETPAFIVAAAAKRAAIVCDTCRDTGHVRGVGARAGQAYRTADGAAAAKAAGRAVPCPSHKRAKRAA